MRSLEEEVKVLHGARERGKAVFSAVAACFALFHHRQRLTGAAADFQSDFGLQANGDERKQLSFL
jgi:hypothetical protein